MSKGRVLVTGGAGFIGSHIVEELLDAGYTPFVVDDLSSGTADNLPTGVGLFQVDIRDASALSRVFAEVGPRFVCHQAAQISVSHSVREPALDADVNLLGWLRVLQQCVRAGVERVVFASSGGVLYGDVETPAIESQPICPISPYGISKSTGEQYLQFYATEYGLPGVSLRYGNVYGPRQNPHGEAGVVAIFARKMLTGQPVTIHGDGGHIRDYVFVSDVARVNRLALERALPESFTVLNVGTGVGTSVMELEARLRELAQRVRSCGSAAPAVPDAQYGPSRPGDLRSSLLSAALAHKVLGWQPRVSLHQGLEDTVNWFATQTPIAPLR